MPCRSPISTVSSTIHNRALLSIRRGDGLSPTTTQPSSKNSTVYPSHPHYITDNTRNGIPGSGFRNPQGLDGHGRLEVAPRRVHANVIPELQFRYRRREQMNSLATFLGYILVTGLVVYLMVTL